MELNLTNLPSELELILDLLKENDISILNNKYKSIDIKWGRFLELAYHHRLYPILYKKLSRLKIHWLPSSILQKLRNSYEKNTFHMLFLFGEMEEINQEFKNNGIGTLFLKGPLLAKDIYEDLSSRTCGDLDILIPFNELNNAEKILNKLGYEKDEYIKSLLGDWKWRHHHFTYYHKEKNTKVEIHWRLNPAPSLEPAFSELWSRKRQYLLNETPIYYLGKEDLFYFLVSHGARHGWSRLRWLLDIHYIIRKDLNWSKIKPLLIICQSEKLAGQSLILARHIFNTPIPDDVKSITMHNQSKQLAKGAIFYLENMVSLHNDQVPIEISKYHARYLFSLMTLRQKSIYLLSILHPFYTDAEILPLPRKLHFLYFPLRPFLWLWKKKRTVVS